MTTLDDAKQKLDDLVSTDWKELSITKLREYYFELDKFIMAVPSVYGNIADFRVLRRLRAKVTHKLILAPMSVTEIPREEYLRYYSKNKEMYDKTIDPNQYSDKYYTLDFKSFVGLHFQKGNIVQVNGLFSTERGYGRSLLNYVVSRYEKVRLNCTNSLITYYSKYWDVDIYYTSEDLDYCELFVKNK